MYIGNIEVKNPVFLAPMAGVTDWAFRTVCAELGAEPVQCIGRRFVMYRPSKENPRIVLE